MLATPIIFFWVEQQDKGMEYEHDNFEELGTGFYPWTVCPREVTGC